MGHDRLPYGVLATVTDMGWLEREAARAHAEAVLW